MTPSGDVVTVIMVVHIYNYVLASCPLGPVTANGVDVLTEMYVIYMEAIPKFKPLGPLAAAVGSGTHIRMDGRKEGKLGNI